MISSIIISKYQLFILLDSFNLLFHLPSRILFYTYNYINIFFIYIYYYIHFSFFSTLFDNISISTLKHLSFLSILFNSFTSTYLAYYNYLYFFSSRIKSYLIYYKGFISILLYPFLFLNTFSSSSWILSNTFSLHSNVLLFLFNNILGE